VVRRTTRGKKIVGHGNWLEWQKQNLKFSIRTAQVYMSIVKHENQWKNADSAYLTLQGVLKLIAPANDDGGNIGTNLAIINGANTAKALCSSLETTYDSNNWGTPKSTLDFVKQVLGTIGLDPASSDLHQKRVQAERHFPKENDGLTKKWDAETLFLNPPYSESTKWFAKALEEFESGRVKQMVILIHDDTKTKWWHSAFQKCDAVCFTRGTIKCHHPGTGIVSGAPPMGSHVFFFGPDAKKFKKVFSALGTVATNTWAVREAKVLKLRAVA
jgi:phage N-6-adenine-methyltransferase